MIEVIDRKIQPKLNSANNVKFVKPNTLKLNNGINIHLFDLSELDFVKIEFIFKAGSAYSKNPLTASATSSMLLEGSDNLNSKEISEAFDFIGAEISSKTTKELAVISLTVLNKFLPKALELLSKVIFKPKFDEKELEIYLKNKKQAFLVNSEKVSYIARNKFLPLIFGESHPYSGNIKLEDFSNVNTDDLKEFYKSYFTKDFCDIIISGKINDDLFSNLNSYFGNNSWNINDAERVLLKDVPDSNQNKFFIEKKDAVQNALRMGKLVLNRTNKDFHDLSIANTVLGGFFGSRLMKNIREDKGYTYGIGSGILNLNDYSIFFISSELGFENTQLAIDEIYKEIRNLADYGLDEIELSLVKNYLYGSLLRKFDGPFEIANRFKEIYFNGLDYTFYQDYLDRIKSIKSIDIQNIIKEHILNEEMFELVVGNNKYNK